MTIRRYALPPLLLLCLAVVTRVVCSPDGAPTRACATMTPFHGGGIPPQPGLSPYSVVARRRGGKVHVSVGSALGVPISGIMMQARTPSGEVLGSFEAVDPEHSHTINCVQRADTVTHNSPEEKDHIDVDWIPPRGYEGPVMFNATIAQAYDTFWVAQSSPVLQYTSTGQDDLLPDRPFRPPSLQTTTYTPFFNRGQQRTASTEFDPFYTGCSTTKLCFGFPEGCVASKGCTAAVAVTVIGDRYDYELKVDRNDAIWVAVGLSEDAKMGDDSVMSCVKTNRGVDAYMEWTYPGYKVERIRNAQHQIELLNSSVVNGAIYCRIRRNAVTVVNGKTFDQLRDTYHLLVAAGTDLKPNSVGYHTIGKAASAEKRSLADVSAVSGASKLLVRLHGSFMLAAWIGTASIGILLARYYRQTWVGTTMMGKDLWFAWHRVLMVLTWLLTMTAFILIFVELKAWSAERNPHAILGTITTILCFFQPIGAYFRPHPGTSKRPIFNWAHWLAGNAAHIVGIVAIFFAVKLSKAELPDFFDYIMVAYVVVHAVTHLLLSLLNCISDKSSDSRVSSFPMKDIGLGRNSGYLDRSLDSPFSPLRRLILGVYIVLVGALLLALIIITALAPIEDTWTNIRTSMKSSN
nr:unnamed protein product [Callosobruchus chinensis]